MTSSPQPWFRHTRNQIIVVVVIVVIVVSAYVFLTPSAPRSPNQVALDRTVGYFVNEYNYTLGLVPEFPGANVYWLYSDNYLASVALSRYDPSNQSTSNFGLAISQAIGSYAATLPRSYLATQYAALNSTSASFSCPQSYRVSWSAIQGDSPGPGSAFIQSTAYNGDSSCGSQNYADTLLLEAVLYHDTGSSATATSDFQKAAGLFDGTGFADIPFTNSTSTSKGVYQTYKLALYVIASTCLGLSSNDTTLATVEGLLLHLQDNSTGGFFSGYMSPGNHGSTTVNTETTALAALALESMINPAASC